MFSLVAWAVLSVDGCGLGGRVAICEWLTGAVGVRAEVHATVSDGKLVMHERTDHFLLGGKEAATPVAAAFVVDGGLIHAWREYFDMSPFVVAPS